MNLRDKRADSKDAILKGIFIRRELQAESKEIETAQTSLMARRGFKTPNFFTGRKMNVQDSVLHYDHLAKHRFVDMKRRQTPTGGAKKKKNHPIHNRILFGHANNIVKRLSFGYTEAVKQEMIELEKQLNPTQY